MTHDISRNVVAILLVLVILVSVIGTWAFMTQFESRHIMVEGGPAHGQVQLSIAGAPPELVAQQAMVQLTIASTEGQ